MPKEIVTLLRGDKVDSTTDYIDAIPLNVSGVLRPMLNSKGYMLQQPGLSEYGEGEGADRGGVWNSRFDNLYRLSGESFISVSANGTTSILGTIEGADQAAMPYSFNNQAIVANLNYYLYNPTDGFRQIEDESVGAPIDATWIDGLFVFTDGENLYHTEINDEEAIEPINFATSEFAPDPTLGVGKTTDDKLIAFNRFSIEYFYNTGAEVGFLFARIPARNVQYGIVGTKCKAQIGGEWYFMGGTSESDTSVYWLQVGTAKNISSRSVDKIIGQYTESQLASCILETRVVDNYSYLIVRLPNETLMLNLTLMNAVGTDQSWTVLQSGTISGNPYRGLNWVFDPRASRWVCGDYQNDTLGYLDSDVATHYEEKVECAIYTPFIYLETVSLNELMIQTIPGFTATADATVAFSMTYDGLTYGMENWIEYGEPSAYGWRFIIRRLGYVRNFWAFKLRWISESRMVFSTAILDYS